MQDNGQTSNNLSELKLSHYLKVGDKFVFYIYNKSTKICYAIYAITEIIKDEEPIKWKLRKVASNMLSLKNFTSEDIVFYEVKRSLMELESLLELAHFSKSVSFMNYSVFKGELNKVLREIEERSSQSIFSGNLLSNFFEITKPAEENLAQTNFPNGEDKAIQYKTISKGHDVRYDFYKNDRKTAISQHKDRLVVSDTNKNSRREKILDVIKDKVKSSGVNSISIKDITNAIKDCSEKTIQRELITLVSDNVLLKSGERRWSTYSLKTL